MSIPLPSLLVASPTLTDNNFRQAVILLLEQNEFGSFGFVINNLSDNSLDQIIENEDEEVPKGIAVWDAGPVDSFSAYILHSYAEKQYDTQVDKGIYLFRSACHLKYEALQRAVYHPCAEHF